MEQFNEDFSFESLEDYGADALGAAGTACSNNSSNGSSDEPDIIIIR